MSFDKTFNSSNKFILGSTKLKSRPSTGGPTLRLNNDKIEISSSAPLPTTATTTSSININNNNNNNNNNTNGNHINSTNEEHSDELISLLENINHSSLKSSGDDNAIQTLMSGNESEGDEGEAVNSSSSSDGETNEELNEKKAVNDVKEAEEETIAEVKPMEHISEEKFPIPHESSSHSITIPIDVTQNEVIKPSASMEIQTKDNTPSIEKPEEQEEQIPFDFQVFLKQLKSKECQPIVKYIKSFMKQFSMKSWTFDEQAKLIKDFESFILEKFTDIEQFKNLNHAELVNVKEGFEKLIMSRLYTQVFPPALVNTPKLTPSHKAELIQDVKLAENLIKFQWIENKHLDIPESIMESSKSFITLSCNELNKLNNYKSPRDKIICILNCCKVIFGLIRKQQSKSKLEENADTFVPLLIYIILKAKPKHLISNIEYIERFRNESFLNGEAMYYLSSLQLAANFIVKVDFKLLTIEEDEFNAKVAEVEAELKVKKEEKEKSKIFSPAPLIAGALSDERLQDLSPSQILATSANALQQKFNKIFSNEDEEENHDESDNKVLSKIKKLSIQEHEEQLIHSKKLEEVYQNLKSIFPNIEDDILKDIIVLKNYNIGDCIDSCLELAA